ncbi:MAG: bifunctional demethylmenaquinone methyltransferase/2-methoxy-6-polyprenyl-1,4-benzoquinol methylase UbiE [Myxococcota bacterium]
MTTTNLRSPPCHSAASEESPDAAQPLPCHPDEQSEEGSPQRFEMWRDSSSVLHQCSGQTQNDRGRSRAQEDKRGAQPPSKPLRGAASGFGGRTPLLQRPLVEPGRPEGQGNEQAEPRSGPQGVWHMFNRLAKRYDRVNRVLSLGLDHGWRRALSRHLPPDRPLRLLDVATGTGDVVFSLLRHHPRIHQATGVDMAEEMLQLARHKAAAKGLTHVEWRKGDATNLPFAKGSFDVVTMAFGLRNVSDPRAALRHMHRMLAGGGRVLMLEFSMPRSWWLRPPYLFYLRRVLPWIGGLLSGQPQAYRYLDRTIEAFATPDQVVEWLRRAGFIHVRAIPLTGGIVTLYEGAKGPLPPEVLGKPKRSERSPGVASKRVPTKCRRTLWGKSKATQ